MKRFVLSYLLMASATVPAMAALQAGAVAPDFQAEASLAGKPFAFHLKEALRKGPVVVYFYPSAYTGGCNIQAHAFAVNNDKFVAAGATIIGVSLDSIERLNDYSADPQYCAGKFPTASDPNGRIAGLYELAVREAQPGRRDTRGIEIGHGFAERTTFVIAPDGKIAATVGGLPPAENVERTLELVERLSAH